MVDAAAAAATITKHFAVIIVAIVVAIEISKN